MSAASISTLDRWTSEWAAAGRRPSRCHEAPRQHRGDAGGQVRDAAVDARPTSPDRERDGCLAGPASSHQARGWRGHRISCLRRRAALLVLGPAPLPSAHTRAHTRTVPGDVTMTSRLRAAAADASLLLYSAELSRTTTTTVAQRRRGGDNKSCCGVGDGSHCHQRLSRRRRRRRSQRRHVLLTDSRFPRHATQRDDVSRGVLPA